MSQLDSSHGEPNSAVSIAQQWIVGQWQDALLVIGTPLLLLPIFTAAEWLSGTAVLTAFATVFALGHHLPGMMRAYGDRALFRRYRLRFILAPMFLVSVAIFCAVQQIHAAILLAFVWGAWHWMMQSYGFMRIYDAKAKSFTGLTKWLDFAMCVAWFGFALLLSPRPIHDLLFRFYETGGAVLPAAWVAAVQQLWLAGTVLVTVAFVVHTIVQTVRGRTPSPLKLVLMVVTFAYYWYTLTIVPNGLVAYALFEMYHDVQYLTIVWLFNRNRAQKGDNPGAFTKFLFRQRGVFILIYVALCLSYGSFDFAARNMESGMAHSIALSLVLASSMLHFYYDGFIWKIREQSTGETLGLQGSRVRSGPSPLWGMLRHGLIWSLFVVPLAVFGYFESSGMVADPLDRSEAVARTLPDNPDAQSSFCAVLLDHGELQQALEACQRAIMLNPKDAVALENMGNIHLARGQWQQSASYFRLALQLKPDAKDAHNGLGIGAAKQGSHKLANDHFQQAIKLDPDFAVAYANWAESLRDQRRIDEAIEKLERALALDPKRIPWRVRLGRLYLEQDQIGKAESQFRRATAQNSEYWPAYEILAAVLTEQDKHEDALGVLRDAIQCCSQQSAAWVALGQALARNNLEQEAEDAFRRAIDLDPKSGEAQFGLGLRLMRKNDLLGAESAFQLAVEFSPDSATNHHHLGAVLAMQRRYVESTLHFRRALDIDPNFLPAQRTLIEIERALENQ